MKIRSIIKRSMLTLAAASLLAVTVGTTVAAQGTIVAPATPAFNIHAGEQNFVQIRKNMNNDNKVLPATNPYSDSVNAACSVGEKFDINTFIHNGANDEFNDNGNGTAVAHDVTLAMSAPLNQKQKNFTFSSTVTGKDKNGAAITPASDSTKLNCASDVELKLVAQTVNVYSAPYGWRQGSDSAVNGTMPIGSPNFGSGELYGCFQYIVVIVYTVEVKPVPPTPTPTPQPKPPVTVLPNTGAGDVLGIVGATTVAGAAAHSLRRKVAKKFNR